jgi:RHS repeat-associated protein
MQWDYEYNDAGYISKITDPGGKSIDYSYEFYDNENSKLKKIIKSTADESVKSFFNDQGQIVRMEDQTGNVYYEYDESGLLKNIKRENQTPVSYTFNSSGAIASLSLNHRYNILYIYDFLGRLSIMKTPVGEITYKYYTGENIVIRQLPNGVRTEYKYFVNGKLESITHIDKENYIITKYTYEYNFDGLITSILEWTKQGEYKLIYEYDKAQRLILHIDRKGSKTEYMYDNFGNRTEVKVDGLTTENYTFDWCGRMLTSNGNTCQHDESGNLVSINNEVDEYLYTSFNQLKKINNTYYEYDGHGIIITRIQNNQKTIFTNNLLSDIWQPLLAHNNDTETFYIWEKDTPIATIENGKPTYFLTDHLSSVRCIIDNDGNLQQHINYSPFGVPEQTLNNNNFIPGFTGLLYESEAKLYFTKARSYNPTIARFLQPDPLHQTPSGTQKDLSIFVYCGSDPVNFIDKEGMKSVSINEEDLKEKINIESVIKKFVRNQWLMNYPNKNMDGYLECFQWQNRIYTILKNSNLKHWDVKRYAETDPVSAKYYKHFFIVLVNKDNSEIKYRIDPWRGHHVVFPFLNFMVTNELKTGEAGKLQEFIINQNYEENKEESEEKLTDDKFLIYLESHPSLISSFFIIVTKIKILFNKWIIIFISFFDHLFLNFKDKPQFKNGKTSKTNIKEPKPESKLKKPSKDDEGILFPPPKGPPPEGGGGDRWDFDGNGGFGGGGKGGGGFWGNIWRHVAPISNVGGVYLSGAGKSFEGLGQLSGIGIDESNGKLVLISEDKGEIDLPPLRIDDLVTIFRSVYLRGEAPFVSIDPDPNNPRGPIMLTRHGDETINTYVGWILFEADRIMKAYSLGEDNITKKVVQTSVAGYDNVINEMFDLENKEETWERFWIVPSKLKKNISTNNNITLFDVPLLVKTEKMELLNGKLVTATNGTTSKGAQKFSDWFTSNYDIIAEETFSIPPEKSGFSEPVPVLKELKRIALITAIAEQLRDQGVEFPFWMRNYEIKTFQTPVTTPAHKVVREKGNSILSVYGGVKLTTADENIVTVKSSPQADSIHKEVKETIKKSPFIKSVTINDGEKKYNISTIPGSNTKDFGPCIINETDLKIKINGNNYLAFTRKFNSFISSNDKLFGNYWSLDLPFLEIQKLPIKRDGNDYLMDSFYLLKSAR